MNPSDPRNWRSPSSPSGTGCPASSTTRTSLPRRAAPSVARFSNGSSRRPVVLRAVSVMPHPGITVQGSRSLACSSTGRGMAAPAQTKTSKLDRSRPSSPSTARRSARNGVAPIEAWMRCSSISPANSTGSHTSW